MSIAATSLRNKLVSNTKEITKAGEYWNKFAQALNEYFSSNIEVVGSYIGAMPNGKPSGMNGNYTWGVNCNIVAASLESAIKNSDDPENTQSKLSSALASTLRLQIINVGSISEITIAPVMLGCSSINFDFSSKPTEPSDTNLVFANAIVTGIKSALPTPAAISAIGSDGSTGLVTFSLQT